MKVLIADKFESQGIEALRAAGCEVVSVVGAKDAALIQAINQHAPEVLIVRSTKVTAPMFDAAPTLALVIRAGSGYDTIDVAAATQRNVRVCNCPGANSVAVAELTLGLMIALDRRIVDETADLRRGVWNKKEYSKARGLKGRTLGIVGLGRIGWEVAQRAAAFEMQLLYTDVIPRPDAEQRFGLRRVPLEELLRASDFVTLHVPGGAETTRLIGASQLALMKPTAFLLNCSRGGIVDEAALADAIRAQRLAGAALDVYEVEPTAAESEFKDPTPQLPHVYGTHHVGASTEQAQLAVAEQTVAIVKAYAERGEFLYCVNPPQPAGVP